MISPGVPALIGGEDLCWMSWVAVTGMGMVAVMGHSVDGWWVAASLDPCGDGCSDTPRRVWAFVASGATEGDRSGFAQVSPGEIAQRHARPIRPERPERHGVVRWRCPTDAGDLAGCTGLDEGLALVDVVRCNDRERDTRHHGQHPRAMTAGYVTSIVFERMGVTPRAGWLRRFRVTLCAWKKVRLPSSQPGRDS